MARLGRHLAAVRRRWSIVGIAALCLLAVGYLLLTDHLQWLLDPTAVRSFVADFGVFAPVVFVLVQAAQVIVAPIPGQVLALASGWLFGPVWGTVYSVLGAMLGSYVAFRLVRRFGRPFVERMVDEEWLTRFDSLSSSHGYTALFLVFLVPGIPDDAICLVAGTTQLDVRRMTLISGLGRLPGYFLLNLAGASLASENYVETALIVLVVLAIAFVVYRRRATVVRRLFPR